MVDILGYILERYLYVKRGEEKKVFLFILFFAILMAGQEMGSGVANALFLTEIGIQNLPRMLLIASILNTAAVLGYVALSAQLNNRALFSRILLAGLFILVPARIFYFASPATPKLMTYIMYAASEFLTSAVALHFAIYVSDYFNTRQAKRLVPLIFTGSRIGGIVGGLVLTFSTKFLGSVNILILWAVSLAAGILLLQIIDRIFPPAIFDYEKTSKESARFFDHIKNSLKLFKGSRLMKALTAGIFMMGFLTIIAKFLYNAEFAESIKGADQLTAFFGAYIVISNIVGLFFQLVISNRLIDYFGLGFANLTYAAAFSSSFAGLYFFPNLASAIWARFTDEQLESAIQDPVESLLYNAIADNERARARALSGGLFKPLSEISASIFLQVTAVTLSPLNVALFGFFCTIIYIIIVYEQNRGYVEGLMKMVKEKTLSLDDLENKRWEKASRRDLDRLYAMTGSSDESERDSAATLLLHLDEDINFNKLRQNFFLWTSDIQQDFLRNYFKRCKSIDENFLIEAVKKGSVPVQILIIEFLIETSNTLAGPVLRTYLNDHENLQLQNSAIRFFYLQNEEREKTLDIFHKRLEHSDPEVIAANLSIIKELYDDQYMEYIKKMSSHPNRLISWDAVNTLAEIYQPRHKEEPEILALVDELITKGSYHDMKAAVMILSKRKGEKERSTLLHLLNTPSAPLRDQIIESLAQEYGEETEVFYNLLDSPCAPLTLKENILVLIQNLEKVPDRERLKNSLRKMTEDYFVIIQEQDWLRRNNSEGSLMAEMNERKKQQIRILILQILGLLLHQRVILSIEKALLTNNPRLISNAMELFENIWDKKQAKGLITLLYPESYEEELKISEKFTGKIEISEEAFFQKYLQYDLPRWEICSTLMLMKDHCDYQHKCDLNVFVNHHDPMVREIAHYLSHSLHQEEIKGHMLTTIEKVIFLKNAPIFKSLRMDELKMVADICREQFYEADEIIIEKGDLGNTMFIIASGEVEIFLPGEEIQRLVVLGESNFFGEMALFGDDVRSASAKALKPTKLLCLEREHFINLIYEKPDISIEIIKVLSDRLRRMDKFVRGKEKT